MTLSFALYGGVFTGIEAGIRTFSACGSMVFGVVALAWPGSIFFRGAGPPCDTQDRDPTCPSPWAAAGGVAGTVNALRGRGNLLRTH